MYMYRYFFRLTVLRTYYKHLLSGGLVLEGRGNGSSVSYIEPKRRDHQDNYIGMDTCYTTLSISLIACCIFISGLVSHTGDANRRGFYQMITCTSTDVLCCDCGWIIAFLVLVCGHRRVAVIRNRMICLIPDEELFSEMYVGCTASYFV